ncbi:MAG: YraN family protein [Parcubacteria group bacterium]|nr:YraN family protein [Parcubacteria group bacterium]
MEHNQPKHLQTGKIGEDIACDFLKKKGYKIIDRNFKRKWGEIDIVCHKKRTLSDKISSIWNKNPDSVLHGTKIVFVEVKTLNSNYSLDPEDNLTQQKQKKLIRTCQLYISEKKLDPDMDWQIDAILIILDTQSKKAKIKHMEGVIY